MEGSGGGWGPELLNLGLNPDFLNSLIFRMA